MIALFVSTEVPLTKHRIVYIIGLTWGTYLSHRVLHWDTVCLTEMTSLFSELRKWLNEMKDSSNPFSLSTVINSAFNTLNFQVSFRGGNCWGLEWARGVNYFELKLLKKQSMWEEHADPPFCFLKTESETPLWKVRSLQFGVEEHLPRQW